MKLTLIIIILASALLAQEPKPKAGEANPADTVVKLQAAAKAKDAEIESLKAQLTQLQSLYEFDLSACNGAMRAARDSILKPKQNERRPSQPTPAK